MFDQQSNVSPDGNKHETGIEIPFGIFFDRREDSGRFARSLAAFIDINNCRLHIRMTWVAQMPETG